MKNQAYTITFNAPRTNLTDALNVVGNAVDPQVIQLITLGGMNGNIVDQTSPEISDDLLVLSASRNWTDSAYEDLIEIQTVTEIRNAISNLDCVASVEYDFTDI